MAGGGWGLSQEAPSPQVSNFPVCQACENAPISDAVAVSGETRLEASLFLEESEGCFCFWVLVFFFHF